MDQRESMMQPGSGPYYSSGFQPSPSMNSLSHFQPNAGGNFFGSIAPLDNSSTMSPHGISLGPPPPAVSVGPPPAMLQGEQPVRRKRGRPRKYGREGAASLTLSPSTSSSVPIVGTNPKRRGRPPGPGRKQQIFSIAHYAPYVFVSLVTIDDKWTNNIVTPQKTTSLGATSC
ncbi:hypothetical protein PHJA_001474900 [Phtheirospermum japonicum]|uniref:AT-hook motif nuclear-localized protein n=1 Tax=Phtheirospermum japonicum TaxID=374723 RepID=A0A830CDI2_9LAMI|nr:hypothetical protein PHJA_001474900 [Phtheirospermum japonicum]